MSYVSRINEHGAAILAIAERVRQQFPADWKNAHNHQASGEVYIRRVAHAVSVELPQLQCGLNLKRGNQGLSQDVLCFPNASGARDATGQFAGLEIRDIIVSAGTPGASLVWGDVTQATIDKGDPGGWVKPEPVNGEPVPIPPPAPVVALPGRDEALDELNWLDGYYASPEGLQRENGLSLHGKPDFLGIAAWYLDVYQRERVSGKSRADARVKVITDIQQTDEWKKKHP